MPHFSRTSLFKKGKISELKQLDFNKKEAAKGFIKKHNVDFPNLIAEPDTVAKLFYESTGQHFAGTPTFLVYSPEGELKAAQAGAVPAELIEDFIKKSSLKKVDKK